MEQQEEKMLKIYARQRRRSKSSSSFPLDLTSELLLRLPEKSVVRFRCVSKAWSSITTDPYFIKLFKARSPRLLLCFHAKNKLFASSIPQHHQTFETSNKSYSSSLHIDRYHMKFPLINDFLPHTESVEGLICFQGPATPIVWNPSMRQLLTLPKPCKSWNDLKIFLGYDPVESKFKVMCTSFLGSSDESMVLTLGSAQESWRMIKTNVNTRPAYHTSGRCIKGVVYYLACVYPTKVWVLMSFDVRSEKFDKLPLPPSVVHNHVLITYQGKLACVDEKPNMKNGITLWILEDAAKHKWSSKDFLSPLDHYDNSLGTDFLLKGFTHNGELIYVEHTFPISSCILFCDPVRNTFRRFELKGITDDESLLNNLHRYLIHVVPNHVETESPCNKFLR